MRKTATSAPVTEPARHAAAVLVDLRELRAVSLAAEAASLQQAAVWADLHPVGEDEPGATFHERGYDTGMRLTADGHPEVAADCVAELAAALGMSTGAGERLIATALELRHRLPRLWALVQDGEVAAWQARRVAEQTLSLSPAAAGFVDDQVAAVVGRVGVAQLDRLVTAALIRFMPEEAERRRRQAVEGRGFWVTHDSSGGQQGLSDVWGRLDLPDALALDAAVTEGARALVGLGCEDGPDVRRARALGELARRQPAFDLRLPGVGGVDDTGDPRTPAELVATTSPATVGRGGAGPTAERVVLYLHLSEAALRTAVEDGSARVENTGCPVTVGQIRDWCGRPDARVTVRPLVDLTADHVVPGAEVPDWMRELVALRDRRCVFPFCTRPAHPYPSRRQPGPHRTGEQGSEAQPGWRVDTDHIVSRGAGGPTSTANTAPLCRVHHRLKTFAGWRYQVTGRRSYAWTSPHRLRYLCTPDGATHDLGPDPGALRPPGRRTRGLPYETDLAPQGPRAEALAASALGAGATDTSAAGSGAPGARASGTSATGACARADPAPF